MVDYINDKLLEHLTYIDWDEEIKESDFKESLTGYMYSVEFLDYLLKLTKKEYYITRNQANNIKDILARYRSKLNFFDDDMKKIVNAKINEILLHLNSIEFDVIYEQEMIDEIRLRIGETAKSYDLIYYSMDMDNKMCNLLYNFRSADLNIIELIISTDGRIYATEFDAESLILIYGSLNKIISDEPSLLEDKIVRDNIGSIIGYTNKIFNKLNSIECLMLNSYFKSFCLAFKNNYPKIDESFEYLESKKLDSLIYSDEIDEDLLFDDTFDNYIQGDELPSQILYRAYDNIYSCNLNENNCNRLKDLLYANMAKNQIGYDLSKYAGLSYTNEEEYNQNIRREYISRFDEDALEDIDAMEKKLAKSKKYDYSILRSLLEGRGEFSNELLHLTINNELTNESPLLKNKMFVKNLLNIYKELAKEDKKYLQNKKELSKINIKSIFTK